MADLSDVENAIVAQVTNALYPQGLSEPSIVGVTCRIYRGWPTTAALNSDLAGGLVNVTVFPATMLDEVPEPYFDRMYTSITSTNLTATVAGSGITISGIVESNQVVGLLVDGVPFSYRVNASDTVESVAANLALVINADRIATLSGSSLTIPDVRTLTARVVTNATVSEGLRRQRRVIQVSCWCPSPALRDSICKSADMVLSTSSFINLSDETRAHVHYVSTQVYDQSQNALLYRRDLCYKCEYTLMNSTAAPIMLFGDLVNGGNSSFL